MISWIVASHDADILDMVLRPSLDVPEGDELIVIGNAPSIADAYNQGTAMAANQVRCYIHHDVRILDLPRLRTLLLEHCTAEVGMVGVVGSRTQQVPWWDGQKCGSVTDTRYPNGLDFTPGGEPCAYLDGLLLATAQPVTWDESYAGWHLYDHDMCQQQLAVGRVNWCLPAGRALVSHENGNPGNVRRLPGWDENAARFRAKWGL